MERRRPIEAGIRAGERPDGDETRDAVRDAFAAWVSGVTIVAVRAGGKVHGLTVSAFLPLSLDPPLLLVSIAGDSPVASHIDEQKRFVVNVLARGQRGVATRFADRYPIAPGVFPEHGDPVLEGAVASFVCAVDSMQPAGDHRIVIGRITRAVRGSSDDPLAFFAREYRGLA